MWNIIWTYREIFGSWSITILLAPILFPIVLIKILSTHKLSNELDAKSSFLTKKILRHQAEFNTKYEYLSEDEREQYHQGSRFLGIQRCNLDQSRSEVLTRIRLLYCFFVIIVCTNVFHLWRIYQPSYAIQFEQALFQIEKQEIEDAHKQEILEAQRQLKLAEIRAQRAALHNNASNSQAHSAEITQLKNKIQMITAKGADYSKLSQATISSSKSEPVNEQTKLILSALWLGACFFLQRLFERLFHDKGYALLTVCAAGFLIAFFTANYFLLGGSVTGGIMGSVGERT